MARSQPIHRLAASAALVALCALLYALVISCWQSDDAYITYRTVHNFWRGDGLTWNWGERVQAYTHPLWMGLCLLLCGLTSEFFFSMSSLSIALSWGVGIAVLALWSELPLASTALLLVLTASKGFVDYCVCGLENPLLYLLLLWAARASHAQRSAQLCVCLGLAMLTRIDALLLLGPALLHTLRQQPLSARRLLVCMAPLWVWLAFSLAYYGTPLPNTAIAKLNLDVPRAALLHNGVAYLLDSAQRDPITSVAIVLLTGYCAAQPGVTRWLAFGATLYLLYIVFIGGDFMSGRFHGAPLLLLGVSALSAFELRQPGEVALAAAIAALLLYALAWPASPLRATASYGAGWSLEATFSPAGMGDERAYYYPTTGLLPVAILHNELVERALPIPPDHKAVEGLTFARSAEQAAFNEAVGFFGFYADRKPVIDILGLTDPLLARIPFQSSTAFRPGHYERMLPAGYLQSRRTDENLLQDTELREAYAQLRLITGGALWDLARWRAIWRLNTGYYRAAFTRAAVDLASVP